MLPSKMFFVSHLRRKVDGIKLYPTHAWKAREKETSVCAAERPEPFFRLPEANQEPYKNS